MTPHQKIMRAAERGTGLRLTAEEVGKLSRDGAIETCAANDDEDDYLRKTTYPHPKLTRASETVPQN
jgi:hypothetical protein